MSQNAIEDLFATRWIDVVSFVKAFRDFEDSAVESFEKAAGPVVKAWLAEQGYEMDLSPKDAEFYAYKSTWLDADSTPIAKFRVGGLFPKGLAKVDAESPYLWVSLHLDKPTRKEVAEHLARATGPSWLPPEVTDRWPVGRHLHEAADKRFEMARDPRAMAAFVIANLPAVLALEGHIESAMRLVRSDARG